MTTRVPITKELPASIRKLLRERIQTNLDLPLQPHTAAQVISVCQDPEGDARRLSELIERDPSLAGHVLGIANSAAYAAKEQIVSLQQAVGRLGISAVCEIAVAVSLKGKVFDVPGYATRIRALWMHSAAAAVYAREIALQQGGDAEGLFLCGLLHDVGMPVVLQNLSDLAREKTDKPVPRGIMEMAMAEFHEEVGALLVEHWEFPEWMSISVGHHKRYEQAGEHRRPAAVLNLASELSHWALDAEAREQDFPTDLPVLKVLGIDFDDLSDLLALRGRVLEIADAFL